MPQTAPNARIPFPSTIALGPWQDDPCFYVSILDGTRHALLLGPFRAESVCREYAYLDEESGGNREKHLAMIRRAEELDAKSCFYAFGMVKVSDGHRCGVMNSRFAENLADSELSRAV